MNVVLYHAGSPLPTHLSVCIKQIQYVSPGTTIYLITDQVCSFPDVDVVYTKELNVKIEAPDYFKGEDPLWSQSLFRFFYIRELMLVKDLEDVLHFDNDVLIYTPVDKMVLSIYRIVHEKGKDLAITMHTHDQCVCGMMYIEIASSLDFVCDKLSKMIAVGKRELEQRLGHMPHEMRLLGFIQQKWSPFYVLPSLPKHDMKFWDNEEMRYELSGLFDPSSYGQFIGGTLANGGNDDGKVHPDSVHRIVDEYIIADAIKVVFDLSRNQYPVVYDKASRQQYRLNNLHIHSKQLEKFKTYP